MTGRIKKHVQLCVLLIVLIIVTVVMDWALQYKIQQEGDCIESLYFVIGNSMSKQKVKCYQDEAQQCCYLFLPAYANVNDVCVFFNGGYRIIFTGEDNEIILKRGEDIGALTYGKPYDMRFVDREGVEIASQKMMVMQSANIPALFLETESGTMDYVDADKEYEEQGNAVFIDMDGRVVYADERNHISGRGNTTWAYPKKSYGIKLKNRADLFGMGSAENWVLLSNVMDRTYIRNKITYEMAIAAGLEGSPQSQYIDLYINNSYHGMYLLCEKVEIDAERVPIKNLGEQNRALNKNIDLCERFEAGGKKGVVLAKDPGFVSGGGYLLERDVPEKFDKEISGFQTQILGDLYTIKNPKYASPAQVDYISAFMCDMEKAVVDEDGISPDTGISYLDYIDLKSFAQKYVVEELSKNQGGGASSSFFYKPEDAVSTKLLAGPVWDYDKAYARQSGMDESTRDLCYLTQRFNCTLLFWHLYSHSEFQEMVSSCYAEFFSDYIQLVEEEKIDAYLAQICAAADMDSVRWKSVYGDTADWTQEVDRVRIFLSGRKEFLDEVWIEKKELCTVHFVAEDFLRDSYMSVIRGEALQSVPIGEPGEHMADLEFDGWYLEDGTPFDMTRPICSDITVYGRGHLREKQEQ